MGNTNTTREVNPQLHISYSGKLSGRLSNHDGTIQSNHNTNTDYPLHSSSTALDPQLMKRLLESLGDPKEVFLIKSHDLQAFEINIISPQHPEYRPVFFDRKNEYGKNHTYYEALCHCLPHRDVIYSSSARYFNSKQGNSLLTKHLPSPLPITAFIESFRSINSEFLQNLETVLLALTESHPPPANMNPQTVVKEFIDGAFRNIAIQIHFNSSSYERQMLYHMDHVFSALHMAVTLNGRRVIGFSLSINEIKDFREVTLAMQPGDVYITTPAGILHGVSMDELTEDERSVAIQCRTLLGAESAKYWCEQVSPLCIEISKLLAKFPLRIPSYDEWEKEHAKLLEKLIIPENKFFLFKKKECN